VLAIELYAGLRPAASMMLNRPYESRRRTHQGP
jgi:hypothetical protein